MALFCNIRVFCTVGQCFLNCQYVLSNRKECIQMLAWTRSQIERGRLNSKLLSKSFLEFSRRVHEQEVGKRKGIKPMESFSLQTLTFNNEFPRLPPSTPGGENFPRKGTREALTARRGIQSQSSTVTDTAPAER